MENYLHGKLEKIKDDWVVKFNNKHYNLHLSSSEQPKIENSEVLFVFETIAIGNDVYNVMDEDVVKIVRVKNV